METINDVMNFLSKLNLEGCHCERFGCIRKIINDEFQNINSERLIHVLILVDDMYILSLTRGLSCFELSIDILRDDIF